MNILCTFHIFMYGYVAQVSTVKLKTLLNAVYKVIDNACTFILGDRLNILKNNFLRCCNMRSVTSVYFVLE